MRYFTEKPANAVITRRYKYKCDHPIYSECSLIKIDDFGLSIIQKRFNAKLKIFWYGAADSWLIDQIQMHKGFESYFTKHAGECQNGLYPTITVRQIMWALKMKPLKKSWWESHDKQLL